MFGLPPPSTSLAQARESLAQSLKSLDSLDNDIKQAEAHLADIVREAQCQINQMRTDKAVLEDTILKTKSYLAPIRRLPSELLRSVFMFSFQDHPCCCWVLAAVCSDWRRLALDMPKLWSKVRLITTQHSSPDTIRLWLERSGSAVPLDIEIFLRVSKSSPDRPPSHRGRPPPPTGAGPIAHYVIPHPTLPPAHTPLVVPITASGPIVPDMWNQTIPSSPRDRSNKADANGPRGGSHWGHIAMFYLVEQMHRWQRFVFRFQKQFHSMDALTSIAEFEVSSAESLFAQQEWPWLPSHPFASSSSPAPVLSNLRNLTLQRVPFKWSSPMFHTNLHTINLRSLHNAHLSLSRIFHILHANRDSLKCVSFHFQSVTSAILPLTPLTLPNLTELSMGGHHLLTQLIDTLILPNLHELNLDVDARDPIEDTIVSLVGRMASSTSSNPNNMSMLYYGGGSYIMSWTLLNELSQLESLRVGGTPMDSLLSALSTPDDDLMTGSAAAAAGAGAPVPTGGNNWLCPNLVELGLKQCHAHPEGVGKLVQMIEARNPVGGGQGTVVNGVAPVRLKSLELYESATLDPDVMQWIDSRVDEVNVTENERFDR
ncbi:hypothetical protein K435DRAFT_821368 [Dendrothele bispora CBS 962.96]|uniref:Uncharacterized protein n=1 Tax=Dendrothele bispora (strain CBS 962.96) TaxID=1314807 RepID=A0A4S8LK81_DENBC|nr:hypothetical protein K435DRAFT_821368 [Dendrothele bispora CBS 962.96]